MKTKHLPAAPDVFAPDGSEVRILVGTSRGSMAHFKLLPGQVAKAIRHRTVDELWFVTKGAGEIWRRLADVETVTALSPGLSLSIPVGTSFQFRCTGEAPLEIVGVTMPPWPGENEAEFVDGRW
ncbi:MAG: cupin domain-containing protein [Hyphomicrobiales bacterium]